MPTLRNPVRGAWTHPQPYAAMPGPDNTAPPVPLPVAAAGAAMDPTAPGAPEPPLMTSLEVARFFGVTERTIWNWRVKGLLTAIRVTRRSVFYRPSEVRKLVDKSM